jgi:transcription initiation factor TFIID subunit TAF12
VCEPFFEEMLTALQLALQQQQQQQQQEQQQQQQHQQQQQQQRQQQPQQHLQLQQLAAVTEDNCFQAVFHQRTHLDPMPDDESTTDEVGAFASLLAGRPSSPEEATNVADVLPLAQNLAPTEEKSVMVCRHWRNKGCCRMEDKCKFLHPENKRGVTASKPSTASSASTAGGAGASTTLSLSSMIAPVGEAALPRRRKRGGRDKSCREQHAPQDSPCSSND